MKANVYVVGLRGTWPGPLTSMEYKVWTRSMERAVFFDGPKYEKTAVGVRVIPAFLTPPTDGPIDVAQALKSAEFLAQRALSRTLPSGILVVDDHAAAAFGIRWLTPSVLWFGTPVTRDRPDLELKDVPVT